MRKGYVIACCDGLEPDVSTRTQLAFSSAAAHCDTGLEKAMKLHNSHL